MKVKPPRDSAERATKPPPAAVKPAYWSVLKPGAAGWLSGARLWLYELVVTLIMTVMGLWLIHALATALGYYSVTVLPSVHDVDLALYRAINGLSAGVPVGHIFPILEDPGVLYSIPIGACLLYVWRRRRQDMPLAIAGLVVAFVVGAQTIPDVHQFGLRARPFLEESSAIVDPWAREIWAQFPSFPSGHLRELTGLCVVLVYFWRRAIWGVLPLLILISFLRVFLGAHYPTDVPAGIVIGLASGGFAAMLLWRVRLLVGIVGNEGLALTALAFLRGRVVGGAPLPRRIQLARLGVLLGLLVGVVAALGMLTHVELIFGERILYAYLRNTDYSLMLALQPRFDDRLTAPLYLAFAAPYVTYPALGLLALLSARQHGRQETLRALVALMVGLAVVGLLMAAVVPRFERPLPFQELAIDPQALSAPWRGSWVQMTHYPYPHVLMVTVMATLIASAWPRARSLVFGYALAVCAVLLYAGAAWPTQVVPSLAIGFLIGSYGGLVAESLVTTGVTPASRASTNLTKRE